jgi:hypothetical protein
MYFCTAEMKRGAQKVLRFILKMTLNITSKYIFKR